MKRIKKGDLSDRQKWLYDFVKSVNEINPDRWLTLDDVIDGINCDLTYTGDDRYEKSKSVRSHNPCPSLWADVEAINATSKKNTIILYNNYQIKMPKDIDEARKYYLDDLSARGKKIMGRYGLALWKVKRDKQGILFPEGDSKEFIRACIKTAADEMLKDEAGEPNGGK